MSIVMVTLPDASYGISVRAGLIAGAGHVLPDIVDTRKVAIVTDKNVGAIYLEPLQASLREHGYEPISVTIETGEDHKTFESVQKVYDQLLAARIERSTPMIALGGGIVGDLAGFVAATILRGIPLIQMPTSLLAMVDSSVGGKTGVNHKAGKNMIGAFYQPAAVLADVESLKTLPARELRAGLAECIKHDIIMDGEGFHRLEKNVAKARSLDLEFLTSLIAHNVMLKAKVVENDPFEEGDRAKLNFGHTFGHAFEVVTNYEYLHGECVALGMVAAVRLATRLSMISENNANRMISLIKSAGLPVGGVKIDAKAALDVMRGDKKVQKGKLRFVLPDRIGHVVIRDDINEPDVKHVIESLAS
ncbi:MAG TPA: 3-dehydroquinate synthase [Tepidisphaeraceae bacterium]|nr:3-dehydroquinate synthase [Tepidisphaeraceae bacterium]